MRTIDRNSWSRQEHFSVFNAWAYPHFNMCVNVDLTRFYSAVRERELSFNVAVVYVLARTANVIPEFRHRIHGENVVEYDVVHPSTTIMAQEDLFTFCTFRYVEDFSIFADKAKDRISYIKQNPVLSDGPGEDDLLFMTAIPWVSFTSFMHPIDLDPVDSVPRFAWGKFFQDGEFLKMPLEVQAHHALMDGVHMGQFFAKVQDHLHHPDFVTGSA